MPFEDFTSKPWKVSRSDSAECKGGDEVTISGGEDQVQITCQEGDVIKNPYPPGKYNKDTNRIEEIREDGTAGYQIGLQIMFTPPGQTPITGSWTAEDQGPWPGDE